MKKGGEDATHTLDRPSLLPHSIGTEHEKLGYYTAPPPRPPVV